MNNQPATCSDAQGFRWWRNLDYKYADNPLIGAINKKISCLLKWWFADVVGLALSWDKGRESISSEHHFLRDRLLLSDSDLVSLVYLSGRMTRFPRVPIHSRVAAFDSACLVDIFVLVCVLMYYRTDNILVAGRTYHIVHPRSSSRAFFYSIRWRDWVNLRFRNSVDGSHSENLLYT